MDQEQFVKHDLVLDAVLRKIGIIGEATKHPPDEVRARMPSIEWKKIAGMRDWISHVYYRVDDDIVWDAIQAKVPELPRTLKAFQDENQPEAGRWHWKAFLGATRRPSIAHSGSDRTRTQVRPRAGPGPLLS